MSATLGEIAEVADAELRGDAAVVVDGVATLRNATGGSLSFLSNRRYCAHLPRTAAAAVVLAAADAAACPTAALVTEEPYLGFVKAARYLHPEPSFAPRIHPTAVVADSAAVSADCYVGPGAVLEAEARLGAGVYIGPQCSIGAGAVIGAHSRLQAHVTLAPGVRVGERNLLHPGAVLGADGFGIVADGGAWLKIPQLGAVRLGDDVEIGANTTIDRGALEDTVIEDGVKIDNQVQVGHNVRIGAHTAIAGQVAIAGSATIGSHCMIGGGSCIAGHIRIADKTVLTGMSGVANSIAEPGVYSSGLPITDNLSWRKNTARFKRLDKLARRVSALEEASRDPNRDPRRETRP